MEIKIPLGQISMENNHAEKEQRSLTLWAELGRFQVTTQSKTWKIFTLSVRADSWMEI